MRVWAVRKHTMTDGQIVVVITGIRGKKGKLIASSFDRLLPSDLKRIKWIIKEVVRDPKVGRVVFGGAMGADTVALQYAYKYRIGRVPELLVIVPARVADQPVETRAVTWLCADRVIEMGQQLRNEDGKFRYVIYRNRNVRMLDEAKGVHGSRVVAFWNGQRTRSGTWSTIALARRYYSIPVEVVWLGKKKQKTLVA